MASVLDQRVKKIACNRGDPGSISRSERVPGEGNGNPLQYSRLENSMGRRAWWARVHGVIKSQTSLSDSHFHFTLAPRNIQSKHMDEK